MRCTPTATATSTCSCRCWACVRRRAVSPRVRRRVTFACDTGYNSVGLPILEKLPWFQPSCKLHDAIEQWLRDEVKPAASNRAIIMLSHHQNYSAFEDIFTTPAKQLAQYINRPVLWLWGHEHRLAIYGKARTEDGIESYGRCLGHGGMPVDLGLASSARSTRWSSMTSACTTR